MAAQVLDDLRDEHPGIKAEIEKVTDAERFLEYGLLKTPGFVVNERLVSSGRVPTAEQVESWMRAAVVESPAD
jgi:hypothetical protein